MQIYHGSILSLDRENTQYNYLVEDKGRILYLGNTLPGSYAGVSIIELGKHALLPAFGDGHLHFSSWALIAAAYFDVRQARTISDIQEMITDFINTKKKLKVLIMFGASKHCIKENRLMTREELDAVCPSIPAALVCYDGHSVIFNTRMIERLPQSIKSMRGCHEENGQLFNEAYYAGIDFATSLVSPLTLVNSIIKGYDLVAEKGISLIHPTEGIGFPKDLDVALTSFIAKAQARKNRIQTRLLFQTMDVPKVLKRKLPRIGGCFAAALDGCLGACDAAFLEPYTHDPNNYGILFQTEKTVMDFAKAANREGLQIQLHAIGDAAVRRGVNAIEAALKDFPRKDHRHTLIHASFMTEQEFDKIAELGIGITLQPGFLISPLEPASYLEKILGDRVKTGSPLKSFLNAGIHVSGGSDAPVTPPDPIEGIFGACNHPYNPDESLSIPDALKMFTWEVARGSFDEKNRGSLEIGKIADMVILNQNPLDLEPGELRSLKVEKLLLQGKEYQYGMGLPGMLLHGFAGRGETI